MSTFNEIELTTPYGDTDNVLELNIDSISDVYALQGVIKLPSTYTFSIWYRAETNSQITFNILGESEIVDSTTGWNKYVKTVTVETLDEPNIYIMSGLNISTYFYEGYLTEGIADTSWLPAPEDIDGEISSVRSELIQTADRIEAKITASDGRITSLATDLKGITARVEDAEGNITSLTTDLEGVKSRVKDAEGNITQLQQTSEEISFKAGNAEQIALESKVLSVNLSIESMNIATDSDGNNGSYTNCKTTVTVNYGMEDVTSSATITCTPADGVTGSWDSTTKVYTISNMTVDNGTVAIKATYKVTIDRTEQTLTDTNTFSVTKSKQGVKGDRGLQGLQGEQGDQGIPGKDGSSSYTHIAYANSADGQTDFSVSDSDRSYIGMYVDDQLTDSTNPDDYAWTLVKGADGANGIPGKAGEDGKTPYLHIAYANSEDGATDFSVTDSTDKTYIGQYTDYTEADSTDPTSYQWSKIKGDDGVSVKSITTEYYLSTSDTSVTGGSWSTTPPEKTDTTYIWRREHTVYNDDTESYSSPVLDQSLNKLFVVTAELTVGQEEIRSQVSSVKTEVDNLVYENRNYIKGTEKWTDDAFYITDAYGPQNGTIDDGVLTVPINNSAIDTHFVSVVPGDIYTISIDVKSTLSAKGYITLLQYYDDDGNRLSYAYISDAYDTEWKRISETFTIPDDATQFRLGLRSAANQMSYRLLKMEKGSKATDWSAAPEDVDKKISDSEENVRTTIAEQTTSITQNCEEMILQAAANYVKTGDYEEFKESVSSQLSIMADQISMNFESTTEQIADVDGELQSTVETLSKYFDFAIDGLTIHAGEGEMQLVLDNDIIYFKKNGKLFGWWDGVDFHTGNIVVDVYERAQFGNFAFIPRSDGSLSFLKVDDYVMMVITKQPVSTSVKVNNTATFTVEATGADIFYQWESNIYINVTKQWSGWAEVDGATSNTISVTPTNTSSSYHKYRCRLTDRKNKVLYTDIAQLNITS